MALLRGLADLLFPPACQVCREPGPAVLCPTCRERFRLIRPPVCQRCGKPLRGPPTLIFTCIPCRHRRLHFKHARAAGVFEGPLRDAIHALKFRGRTALSEPLGRLMVDTAPVHSLVRGCEVVVPVPLHPRRLAERGFNQSELLAREVAAALRLPLDIGILQRTRSTAPQTDLPLTERKINVRQAFEATAPPTGSILLVDDVLSTGYTAAACAGALRRGGAREVIVLALARTVLE
ncbi:MAG TPA: ComF family protein [bacterium]